MNDENFTEIISEIEKRIDELEKKVEFLEENLIDEGREKLCMD